MVSQGFSYLGHMCNIFTSVISISTFDQKIPREGAGGLRNEEGMLVRGLQTDEGRVVGLGMGC